MADKYVSQENLRRFRTKYDERLSQVAFSGTAGDVAVVDAADIITATNVEDALNELAQASAGGVASKTVYLVDESAGQSAYAKVYGLYQGSDSSDMTKNTSLGKINLPLDKVLKSATLETQDDQGHTGHFLKLEFQNDAGVIYVDLSVLADIYSGSVGQEVTIVVDGYTVSATITALDGGKINAGTVGKAKLDASVQASLDLADTSVQSVAEGATNGTIDVDGTEVSVHGLGSAAFTDSTAYDASGAAATAKAEVIGESTDVASANTIFGAKAYADSLAVNYATAAQGALADTALQPGDITALTDAEVDAVFTDVTP